MSYPSPARTPVRTLKRKASAVQYNNPIKKRIVNARTRPGYQGRPTTGFNLRRNVPRKYRMRKTGKALYKRTIVKKAVKSSSGGFFPTTIGARTHNTYILDKYSVRGVTCTTEFNASYNWTSEMGVLTVLSMAEEERRLIACKAILKKFATRHELEYEDETKIAFNAGNLRLFYRFSLEGDMTSVDLYTSTAEGADPKWDLLAARLNAAFKAAYVLSDNIFIMGIELNRNEAIPHAFVGNDLQMDLRHCSINFYEKCTVKIQNRTLSQDGDDNSEAVDNVPIYGKIIQGTGCSPSYSSAYKGSSAQTIVPFVVSQATGTSIIYPNIVSQNSMQEPPSFKRIKTATGESKLHLEPGGIKTMLCSNSKSMSLDRAVKNLYQRFNVPIAFTRNINVIGRWTQFYMEKMINVDVLNAVRIAIEVNTSSACQIKLKKTLYTQPYFKKLIDT